MEELAQVSELSLGNAVSVVVSELPSAIQEFLRSPERDEIALRLSQKYTLHADQAGVFQLAYLHMLIGVSSPEEFSSTLVSAGILPETVSRLIYDVNEEVFKPLREKERTGTIATPSPALPTPVQPVMTPQPPVTPPLGTNERTPAPYVGARPQPLTPFNLPGADAHPDDLFRSSTRTVASALAAIQTPAAIVVTVTPPAKSIQTPAAAVVPTASEVRVMPPPAQMPPEKLYTPPQPVQAPREEALGGTLRTMATDMLAVNEHREPEPVQYKGTVFTPPVLMETLPKMVPVSPKPSPIPAPVVSRETSVTPLIRPVTRPTVTPSPSSELITEYSSDPYREPV